MRKHRNSNKITRTAAPASRPVPAAPVVLIFLTVLVAGGGAWWWKGYQSPAADPDKALAQANHSTKQAAAANNPYQRLVGRWLRPDGDYILDIRSADDSGKLAAGYYNPEPINVARAEASGQGSMTKVFIELRDVNYPGSTYTLGYDPASDQLRGVYYQALIQQQFDVVFERLK